MNHHGATLILAAARFASALGRLSLGPLLPRLSLHLGFSQDDDAPLLLSSYSTGYTLTQILGGYIADRYGAGNVLAVCCAASALVLLALGYLLFTVSYWKLAYFILGVAAGPLFPACQVAVNSMETRTEALAIIDSAAAAGATAAALSAAASDYRLVFCGTALLLGLVSWQSKRLMIREQVPQQLDQEKASHAAPALFSPSVVRTYFCHSVDNFTKYSINAWAATIFVERFSSSPAQTALVLGFHEAVSVLARLVAVRYTKSTGLHNSAMAFCLQGIALHMAFSAPSITLAAPLLVLSACGAGMHSTGFRLGYTSGATAGMGNTIASCASIVGPAVLRFVSPATTFGWINVLGAMVAWSGVVRRRRRRRALKTIVS